MCSLALASDVRAMCFCEKVGGKLIDFDFCLSLLRSRALFRAAFRCFERGAMLEIFRILPTDLKH